MGCIVNGPGEMADADFGYVGSGPGKITLYRGKEVMKRNVNKIAVEELINLLKEILMPGSIRPKNPNKRLCKREGLAIVLRHRFYCSPGGGSYRFPDR